jgi:hypothetical protein
VDDIGDQACLKYDQKTTERGKSDAKYNPDANRSALQKKPSERWPGVR